VTRAPTALIADDEPLLREALARQLAQEWPELVVVAQARNGREAISLFEATLPDVCFLDVLMPGISGVEVAHRIGRRAHLVFVTAYDRYAVQAFAQGALDYLVKPVAPVRLAETVTRLRERLRAAQPASDNESALRWLAAQLRGEARPEPLRWIRAQTGATLRLIPVENVDYLRSDAKYTRLAWRDDTGAPQEALVRTALKDLLARLDPEQFVQVHRSVVVNLRAIHHVTRGDESAEIHLKARTEVLPVSRSYLHLFHQM
jgi:DNA-binding LytR/AlgR family response regulator